MGEEEGKENFLENLNKQFTEFVGSVFGESGRDFIEETSEKVKDFSSDAIKKFMEFADDAIDKLNLKENEQVIKTRDSVEDLLKQAGLLKEEEEEEEF
jgi:predicted urease superfamily metal-dependent hydrolase